MFFKKTEPNITQPIKRVFAFGCSMTKYHYPTWADIIGRNYPHFENWGRIGAGNQYIFNSIMECDLRNNLGPEDLVMVSWTSLSRLDCYQFNEWTHFHKLFADKNNNIPANCVDGYEILNYAWIYAVHEFLSSKKVNVVSMTVVDYDQRSRAGKLYAGTLKKIHKVKMAKNLKWYPPPNLKFEEHFSLLYNRLAGPDWPGLKEIAAGKTADNPAIQKEVEEFLIETKKDSRYTTSPGVVDAHALPSQYLDLIDKYLSNFTVSPETRKWALDIEEKLLAGKPYEFDQKLPGQRL